MAVITLNIIEDVYALGKRIVEGTLERKDAILALSDQDMNQKSANMYLTCICSNKNCSSFCKGSDPLHRL